MLGLGLLLLAAQAPASQIEVQAAPHEQIVTYKLHIGTDGRVKRCRVTRSSGVKKIDKSICPLLTARSRFNPARDNFGNPIEDDYEGTINIAQLDSHASSPNDAQLRPLITLEDYPPLALRQHHEGTVRFVLTVALNGRVIGCKITQSSGYRELDAATCEIMRRRARFKPSEDPAGKALPDTYESEVTWSLPR